MPFPPANPWRSITETLERSECPVESYSSPSATKKWQEDRVVNEKTSRWKGEIPRKISVPARFLAYILGALVVISTYLIIPLMITLSPFIDDNWARLLAALGLLMVGEIAVFTILNRTSEEYEDYCAK